MRIDVTIHPARNDALSLALYRDGIAFTAEDYAAITRAQLSIGSTLIDSQVTPAAFDLTQSDRIVIKFDTLTKADGLYRGWLILFDNDKPLGAPIGELAITVKNV